MTETTDDGFFKQKKTPAQEKAARTTNAAQAIVNADASARLHKTARLRELRLEREAVRMLESPVPALRKGRRAAKKSS